MVTMRKEDATKMAEGMAAVIGLLQGEGYSPRDVQGVCLSLFATISVNYLGIPLDTIHELMGHIGDTIGGHLGYKGIVSNPLHVPTDSDGVN
jgi:hypothetical protein